MNKLKSARHALLECRLSNPTELACHSNMMAATANTAGRGRLDLAVTDPGLTSSIAATIALDCLTVVTEFNHDRGK
jgi:hypothetical protein